MDKRFAQGIGLAAIVYIAGCGARVEIRDNDQGTGTGGAGSSGANSSGSDVGSSSGMTSSSGGTTSSSGGVTSSSGGTSSSTSGGISSSSSSGGVICPGFGDLCTECLSLQCADIYCTCYNNPDCFKLSGCTNSCNGNAACEQNCYTTYPNGASDLYALSGCGGTNCLTDCPGTQPLDPCTQCMVETCGDELDACLAFAPCITLYECLGNCGQVDLACQQKCYATSGDGVPKLQALFMCTTMSCPDC